VKQNPEDIWNKRPVPPNEQAPVPPRPQLKETPRNKPLIEELEGRQQERKSSQQRPRQLSERPPSSSDDVFDSVGISSF